MNDFFEFFAINWLFFLALFVVLGMLIGSEVLRRIRGVNTLNVTEALRFINDEDAWILDVRDGKGYKEGHIPKAQHIPSGMLQERLSELKKAKGKPIIVYCQNGSSAQAACALLKKNDIDNVYGLSGGLIAWSEASLPISSKQS